MLRLYHVVRLAGKKGRPAHPIILAPFSSPLSSQAPALLTTTNLQLLRVHGNTLNNIESSQQTPFTFGSLFKQFTRQSSPIFLPYVFLPYKPLLSVYIVPAHKYCEEIGTVGKFGPQTLLHK
jgi:hypothetical protein